MLERISILILVGALFGLGYYALRALSAWRLRRLQADAPTGSEGPLAGALSAMAGSGPALLYFTTETCAQCRFQQAPIMQQLQVQFAALPVVTLDAVQRQEVARHFGIMTVPSTVLLDDRRVPVAINHGVAPLQKLAAQVQGLGNGGQ